MLFIAIGRNFLSFSLFFSSNPTPPPSPPTEILPEDMDIDVRVGSNYYYKFPSNTIYWYDVDKHISCHLSSSTTSINDFTYFKQTNII